MVQRHGTGMNEGRESGAVSQQQWEQLPQESARAFHAFTHYRDQEPAARSIEAAYSDHADACLQSHQKRTISVPSQWKVWSSKNGWVERAKAYDRHCDGLLRLGKERDMVAAQEQWLRQARLMQEMGFEALLGRDLASEPLRELRLMLTEGVRLEREALGFAAADDALNIERGIQVFLEATRPSPEEVAALFADMAPGAAASEPEDDAQ